MTDARDLFDGPPRSALAAWLDARGAGLPPFRSALLDALEQRSEHWWSTPNGGASVADFESIVNASVTGALDDYLAIGAHGRGYASHMYRVCFVEGPVAVVSEILAPSAFEDSGQSEELQHWMAALPELSERSAHARGSGALGPEQRLIVASNAPKMEAIYGIAGDGTVEWHTSRPAIVLDEVRRFLDALAKGGT